MNKRKAVIAMLAATVGLMSKKATMAADLKTTQATSLLNLNAAQTLTFNLASFKQFDFTLDGEKVTLSPAEVFAALKE
jgi:hypothetical protein